MRCRGPHTAGRPRELEALLRASRRQTATASVVVAEQPPEVLPINLAVKRVSTTPRHDVAVTVATLATVVQRRPLRVRRRSTTTAAAAAAATTAPTAPTASTTSMLSTRTGTGATATMIHALAVVARRVAPPTTAR